MSCLSCPQISKMLAPRRVQYMIVIVSIFALLIAYGAEYGFGYLPCDFCSYERGIYFALLAMGIYCSRSEFFGGDAGIFAQMFILTVGIVMTFYHMGLEQHWWSGPPSCTGIDPTTTMEAFRDQLMKMPHPHCDQVTWSFLKISATLWSLMIQAGLGILATLSLYVPREKYREDKAEH